MKIVQKMIEQKLCENPSPMVVNKVNKMTSSNHHTDALAFIADTMLRDVRLTNAVNGVKAIQDYLGHKPIELNTIVTELTDTIKYQVEKRYGPEFLDELNI